MDLRCAVDAYGGFRYWAWRLGLDLSPRQMGTDVYSDADAQRDVVTAVARFGKLPNSKVLRAEGFGRLATRVDAAGGAARFLAGPTS